MTPVAVPSDLEGVVLEMIRVSGGVKATEFKKKLPLSHARFNKRAVEMARELAAQGRTFRVMNGKTELFFATDPMVELDKRVGDALNETVRTAQWMKTSAAELGPAFTSLFPLWLKSALARHVAFKHGGNKYGAQPDIAAKLKVVLKALRATMAKTDAEGIPRELVANELLAVLGLPSHGPSSNPSRPQPMGLNSETFMRSLESLAAENPREALLPIRELRRRLNLGKAEFDAAALTLAREGKVTLHHHDYPAGMSAAELDELVKDERGTHYVGIAIRRGT